MVLSQTVGPVALGLLAGGGLAAGLATVLMAISDSQIDNVVRVSDPLAYTTGVVVIVASCVVAALVPALRAAHLDPIATLRND
jgi:ABC-type antimicrobial peptide transport system permease subunit